MRSARLSPKQYRDEAIGAGLSPAMRILLFYVASHTEWLRAGITEATVWHMLVRNLVERHAAGGLALTDEGRAVLAAMLAR
jgi:hypothetical protein